MDWHFTPLAAPLLVGAALMAAVAAAAVRREAGRGGRTVALLALAVATYDLGYAGELGSPQLGDVRLWLKLQYLGVVAAPGLVLVVALSYVGRRHELSPLLLAGLFTIPATTLLLAFTNDGHELVWRGLRVEHAGFTRTFFEAGPWYWVQNAYAQLVLLLAVGLLVRALLRARGLIRRQFAALLMALSAPLLLHVLYLTTPIFGGLDPNPYGLLLTAFVLAWGVLDVRLWDVVPVAREAVLASMRDAVLVVDGTGRLADLNASAEELLEGPPEGALGRPVEEVFPAWARLAATFPEGDVASSQLDLVVRGVRRSFDAVLTPLSGSHGRADGLVAVLHDLTARRRAEEQLHLQGLALAAAANGILITDGEGRVLWVNPALTRMTGYGADEIVGRTPSLWRSGAHATDFYAGMWRTIQAGRVWHGELVNRRKDGSLYVEEQTITPVLDDAGRVTHFIGIKQDVTARRDLERLRESLTRTMVHDLRNPLTVIHGALDLIGLQAGEALPAPARRALDLSQAGTRRMLALVDGILELRSLESGRVPLARAPAALRDLAEEAVALQTPLAAAKGQHLQVEVEDALPRVEVDRVLVGRVLQNLVGNAVKFTPEGGSVRVAACPDGASGAVRVSVSDDGPGIAPELQERLFQEFVTGSVREQGNGLGLAFCRLAVEAHGGRIWVESEPGRGSTFWFTLPVSP